MKKLSLSQKYWVIFALNLLAVCFHFYLASRHYNLRLGDAQPSLCNINATFDCDTVAASKFSQLLGFPLALWGGIANLVLACWVLLGALIKSPSSNFRATVTTGELFIAFISVIMAVISATQLHSYCLFCIATYIVSFLAALVAITTTQRKDFSGLINSSTVTSVIAVPVLVWLVDGLFLQNYDGANISQYITQAIAEWNTNPQQNFQLPQRVLHKGAAPEKARVTIIEFADFLCPHCRDSAPKMRAFVNSHPDVSFNFLAFPLDGSCNSSFKQNGNGVRCFLAKLVYCANDSDKGWKVHDIIFENQEQLFRTTQPKDILQKPFSQVGIDYDELKACASTNEAHEAILSQAQLGDKIAGTPSVFVNGRFLPGGQSLIILQKAYDSIK